MTRGFGVLPLFVFLSGLLASGCSVEVGADEDVGRVEGAMVNTNALNMNALNMNALNMNGLELSALSAGTLSPQNLSALQDPGPTGTLVRQLVEYVVSCAFSPSQSFHFSWTNSKGKVQNETYWGLLSLAPAWATKPLTTSGQRWISACLASRVNWYGTSVTVSARGSTGGLNVTDPVELSSYTMEEGAFWGNLFGSAPVAYACSFVPNDAYSRSKSRDCAAGHPDGAGNYVDCGIIQRVGSCSVLCGTLTQSGLFHPSCASSQSGTYGEIVTIFLQ